MNKVSLLGMKVDGHKCVSCGKCAKVCKMDVDVTKTPNHTECIRCGKCITACPTEAVSFSYGFGLPEKNLCDNAKVNKSINKEKSITKILAVLLVAVLTLSLASCSAKKNNNDSQSSNADTDIATLMSVESRNAEEAADLYQKLMQKENDILTSNSSLWEKVFMSVNKDTAMIEDGTNYGDFLLNTIEGAKDQFSSDELKTLKEGAEQVKEIEGKLTILEQKYPDCGSKPSSGESIQADSADKISNESELTKFPTFQGKDLDGNDVNSNDLFSSNSVTVVNFWFTTCKPCVGELGELEVLNKELASKGGAVVGVNSFTLDGDKTAISEAKDILSQKGITYKNIWFESNSDAGKFTSGLYSFPTTYVVDRNGNIVGQPIVGAITSAEQSKALNSLIEQAIANSNK